MAAVGLLLFVDLVQGMAWLNVQLRFGSPFSSSYFPKGYHFKRHDFDPEWDNDAECSIAEMEFTEQDSEEDRRLKLRVFEIYNK